MRFPAVCVLALVLTPLIAADGNRHRHLDEPGPYYVNRTFPKLTTPMWVGEPGVDAVVILGIDDLSSPPKWETYLRPILERLKRIDGKASMSIMTVKVPPEHPQLQTWLKEGVSLEVHTIDHPCPMFRDGDLRKTKASHDLCVDLMAKIPNNHSLAFRTPCCDSLNTLSPRFFDAVFNPPTASGRFLKADSSVFHLFTPDDPELPRSLVVDSAGRERFRRYQPEDRSFGNCIENYPYPYVIRNLCWEFPCVTPSDWQAQHLQKPNNALTVRDWEAALDATVLKKGVFDLVFHPHGWIKNSQIVELIDYAVAKYGRRVKFLSFREAVERLETHLLGGASLRDPHGGDAGVRLIDVDGDGFLDVVIANDKRKVLRRWSPKENRWTESAFPTAVFDTNGKSTGAVWGVVGAKRTTILIQPGDHPKAWQFSGGEWLPATEFVKGLPMLPRSGVRMLDLDHDGSFELLIANSTTNAAYRWSDSGRRWTPLPFALPEGCRFADANGADAGLRFVDLDDDGFDDVLCSNESGCSAWLFRGMKDGWSVRSFARKPGEPGCPQPFVRKGLDNGAWFYGRQLWIANEFTSTRPDLVERTPFTEFCSAAPSRALTPAEALTSMHPRPGFKIQLMASEPLVESPISFAWGPDGKFWVVEMGDYPKGADGKGSPGGRIKILEDTDGDGVYDKATLFLDGLSFPTSVLPYRKGALITCAPDILYAEDRDGDGRADVKEVLYTGFVKGNPQHRVNSLVWGLDNWIYGANGDSGGVVKSTKTGAVVDIRGRDFRIRPDTGAIEPATGQTQFGRSRDDWGDWFGGNNSVPMWQYLIPDHYIRRNPHYSPPVVRREVPEVPGPSPVFPASRTVERFNDFWAANRFTSANSPTIYRDDLFGPEYSKSVFISEPVHNLVHREVLSSTGVGYASRRADDERRSEFLASTDNWCRPTTLRTGPDGALWIADMYRAVIEHPEWIPLDWQKRLDLRAGHERGRIYRVFPVDVKPRPIPRLDQLNASDLVAALDSPSGWQRDLAQQLVVQRKLMDAVPSLKELAKTARPLARLHALCTLDGLGELDDPTLLNALGDANAGVRRNAVRLCEGRRNLDLQRRVAALAKDHDPKVQLQVAFTLGQSSIPEAAAALGSLATESSDPIVASAAMTSVHKGNLRSVVAEVVGSANGSSRHAELLNRLMAIADAAGDGEAVAEGLDRLLDPQKVTRKQMESLGGFLEALARRRSSVAKLAATGGERMKAVQTKVEKVQTLARFSVVSNDCSDPDRLAAISVLGWNDREYAKDADALLHVLSPATSPEVQSAAASRLGRINDGMVSRNMLSRWKDFTPAIRSRIMTPLLQRPLGLSVVMEAIESRRFTPADLDAVHRQMLLSAGDADIRRRAETAFRSAGSASRQSVVESFSSALKLAGDPARGKEVFRKSCSNCHRLGDLGQEVGPDLSALRDKSADYLLVNILEPNRAVESRYQAYVAALVDGRTLTGVLVNETSVGMTIATVDGKKEQLLRKDVERLSSTGKSAMPEGIEKDVSPGQMADLLAFLRSRTAPAKWKALPGNSPALVKPAADGSLTLTADNCEIYGSTLVRESHYGNLGFWQSVDDRAVWTIDVPKAGRYRIVIDGALPGLGLSQKIALEVDDQRAVVQFPATRTWDRYREAEVGAIHLPAGNRRIVMRSAESPTGPVLDVRRAKLLPTK